MVIIYIAFMIMINIINGCIIIWEVGETSCIRKTVKGKGQNSLCLHSHHYHHHQQQQCIHTDPAVVQLLCFYNDLPAILPWDASVRAQSNKGEELKCHITKS